MDNNDVTFFQFLGTAHKKSKSVNDVRRNIFDIISELCTSFADSLYCLVDTEKDLSFLVVYTHLMLGQAEGHDDLRTNITRPRLLEAMKDTGWFIRRRKLFLQGVPLNNRRRPFYRLADDGRKKIASLINEFHGCLCLMDALLINYISPLPIGEKPPRSAFSKFSRKLSVIRGKLTCVKRRAHRFIQFEADERHSFLFDQEGRELVRSQVSNDLRLWWENTMG